MSDQSLYEEAVAIAKVIVERCQDKSEAAKLQNLIAQLVDIRWLISPE